MLAMSKPSSGMHQVLNNMKLMDCTAHNDEGKSDNILCKSWFGKI